MSTGGQVPRRETATASPTVVSGPRVALVLWSGHLGGAQTFTVELAGAIRQRGVDARIVFVGGGESLVSRLAQLEVPHVGLGLVRGRHVVRHPRGIAQLVGAAGPDCAILVSSGYLAASLRLGGYRRPIVAVEHGGLLQVDQLPIGRRLLRRIDRASGLWACEAEIAVSEYVLAQLRERRHAKRLLCIRNGIDLIRFSPSGDHLESDRPFTLGYAGRLIAGKGVSDAIRAFSAMPEARHSLLLIAGDGPERRSLEGLASALGVGRRIRFLGQVGDMPGFWRTCDIGVVPSAGWIESFCLSAVESMACGRPVVGSRVGALPETVKDGRTGILVEQGDTSGLAHAFARYARNTSLRLEHGRNGRKLCEEQYDIASTADRYLELIISLSRTAARDA